MKKVVLAMVAASLGLSACMSSTTAINFKDPNTGEVLDTIWERKDASILLASATVTYFDWQGDHVEVVEFAAGATPVQQLSPMVTAGMIGYSMIGAAQSTAPTQITNTAYGGQGGHGGYAYAEGGDAYASNLNWTSVQQQLTAVQWTQLTNCVAPLQVQQGGILNSVWYPGCSGSYGKG